MSRLDLDLQWGPPGAIRQAAGAEIDDLAPSLASALFELAAPPARQDQLETIRAVKGVETNRQEAVKLLRIAAEVEHALLVQYLYAGYSLKDGNTVQKETKDSVKAANVENWANTVLGIAREEMGHLITVQNLLLLLGESPWLQREEFPIPTSVYPFHFHLEPLSRDSLSKYIFAESPQDPPPNVSGVKVAEVLARAQALEAHSDISPHRVGIIYQKLQGLFRQLGPQDLRPDAGKVQAQAGDWEGSSVILVPPVTSEPQAIAALEAVAEQGEGLPSPPPGSRLPHFDRFLGVYRDFPEPGHWAPTWDVPRDPTTAAGAGAASRPDVISDQRSARWARLGDIRYCIILESLQHFLSLRGGPKRAAQAAFLNTRVFAEMFRGTGNLKRLASRLPASFPRTDLPAEGRAAATFRMPDPAYFPPVEQDRWRRHLARIDAAASLIAEIQAKHPGDKNDGLLQAIAAGDAAGRQEITAQHWDG